VTAFRNRACPGLSMATNSVYYLRIPIAYTLAHIGTEAHTTEPLMRYPRE